MVPGEKFSRIFIAANIKIFLEDKTCKQSLYILKGQSLEIDVHFEFVLASVKSIGAVVLNIWSISSINL